MSMLMPFVQVPVALGVSRIYALSFKFLSGSIGATSCSFLVSWLRIHTTSYAETVILYTVSIHETEMIQSNRNRSM
jgi:hypothetical protein